MVPPLASTLNAVRDDSHCLSSARGSYCHRLLHRNNIILSVHQYNLFSLHVSECVFTAIMNCLNMLILYYTSADTQYIHPTTHKGTIGSSDSTTYQSYMQPKDLRERGWSLARSPKIGSCKPPTPTEYGSIATSVPAMLSCRILQSNLSVTCSCNSWMRQHSGSSMTSAMLQTLCSHLSAVQFMGISHMSQRMHPVCRTEACCCSEATRPTLRCRS
jgi:hypothetical protein